MAARSDAQAGEVIRGIYSADEEGDPEFQGVKTFETAQECMEWYAKHKRCTNPRYPQCDQIYTHLCDWDQVCEFLLKPLAKLRGESPFNRGSMAALPAANAFKENAAIRREISDRLDLRFHARVGEESTLNTLRYLFWHMRCGIFVAIKANKLRMLVPFVNKDYRNTWGRALRLEEADVSEYEAEKRRNTKSHEQYMPERDRWWANGNIICNVESPAFWGDNYLPALRHMLEALCDARALPDVEFFINKRDFPHLKRDLSEPYDFIYDLPPGAPPPPLAREAYSTYAPIASFFVGAEFADLPLVSTDDWETATGRVFPPNGTDLRSAKNRSTHAVPWSERTPTAIFRGNSTGPGTDAETNQRIRLAALSAQWRKQLPQAKSPLDGQPYLDAGLVSWNLRDRKIAGRPMTYIKPAEMGFELVERVPMYKQMRYKYQVYVDGHCAAMRYASMMTLGAVILKVDSVTKADSMWFFPLLRAFDFRAHASTGGGSGRPVVGDHIRVAADLSDLSEVIEWCKAHDAECEQVAANATALYASVVAREGQLDYLQLVVWEMSSRFFSSALSESPGAQPPPLPLLAPGLCAHPEGSTNGDWFGADNIEYASLQIGGAAAPPISVPACGTLDCSCPRCTAVKSSVSASDGTPAAASTAFAASAAPIPARQPGGKRKREDAGRHRHGPAAGASGAAAAAAPAAAPFVATDRARKAAAERAALAKAKAAAAAAKAGGAAGGLRS